MDDLYEELINLGVELMMADMAGNISKRQKIIKRIQDLKRELQHAKIREIEELFERHEDEERKKRQVKRESKPIGTNLGDLLREKGYGK